jgi:hypothetical protein
MESYISSFTRKVVDFEILDDKNYIALVSDDSHSYFYRTTRQRNVNIVAFPDKINDTKLSGLQLGFDTQGNRIAYGLYQNNREIVVYSFRLPEIRK